MSSLREEANLVRDQILEVIAKRDQTQVVLVVSPQAAIAHSDVPNASSLELLMMVTRLRATAKMISDSVLSSVAADMKDPAAALAELERHVEDGVPILVATMTNKATLGPPRRAEP